MNKQELYDYIMKSPYNTNPTILKQAIEGLSNNGSNSGDSGGLVNEAEVPIGTGNTLRIFSAPMLSNGVTIDFEGTQMRKVFDQIPNVADTLACTIVGFTDIFGNTTTLSMTAYDENYIVNADENVAVGVDEQGPLFVSADATSEVAGYLGVTESGVYFRTNYNVFGISMLFLL